MRLLQRFFSRWQNGISVFLILIYFAVAIAAPYLSPDDPKKPGPFMLVGKAAQGSPQPPGGKAVLGTFPFGIDVYHALVWGARDALLFGLIVTLSASLFGVLYGAVSGFLGNRLGTFMIRISDSFLAFPPLAGLVFLQQLFGTTIRVMGGFYYYDESVGQVIQIRGQMTAIQYLLERVNPLMLSLIIFSWMPFARLVYSVVLTLRQTEFVQAARALGGSPFWIIRKHILRNSIGPAIVLAARDVGGVVLLQATLTFIQLGGESVWGEMLSQGRNWVIGPGGNLLKFWWVWLPSTLAVMIFGIAWNMFGDGLHDVLEPGSSQRSIWRPFWSRRRREPEPLPAVAPIAPPQSQLSAEVPTPRTTADSTNGTDPILLSARDGLAHGDLSRALQAYAHLIQRGRLIEEVLPDLARSVKSYPHDPQVWQTLGDALARAGRLDHAEQSYEQARKLRQ